MRVVREASGRPRGLRAGVLKSAVSLVAQAALAGLLLLLAGCAPAAPKAPSGALSSPRWYVLRSGLPEPERAPDAEPTPFQPWTTQARVAGFVERGPTLYVAVNGWGVVAAADLAAEPVAFAAFEDPVLFAGRSINGFYADGRNLVVHVYRNTLFATDPPPGAPEAIVRLDTASGALRSGTLPLTRLGWETEDVVHLDDGGWAIAWKRTGAKAVSFRYAVYSPLTGNERFITQRDFLASYDFHGMLAAPRMLRAIDRAVRSAVGGSAVVHYELQARGSSTILLYRSGSEGRLLSGDAKLVTVPVVRAKGNYYALLPGGSVLAADPSRQGAPAAIPLPALPPGWVYTDLWTDGTTLVVSWEQQRFPDVGAAGLFIRALTPASPAPSP